MEIYIEQGPDGAQSSDSFVRLADVIIQERQVGEVYGK